MDRILVFTLKGNNSDRELLVEQTQVFMPSGSGLMTVFQLLMHGPDGLQAIWVGQEEMMELAKWIVEGPVNH